MESRSIQYNFIHDIYTWVDIGAFPFAVHGIRWLDRADRDRARMTPRVPGTSAVDLDDRATQSGADRIVHRHTRRVDRQVGFGENRAEELESIDQVFSGFTR